MPDNDTNLKTITAGITALQKANERIEKGYTEDKEKYDKAAKDVADVLQDHQEMKQKAKAQEEAFDALQKSMLRGSEGNEAKKDEADKELKKFIRKGAPIEPEALDLMYTEMAKKTLHGADDYEIEMFKKDLVAGSNADGGFWLTTDRSGRISTRIFETSALRAVATTETTTSDVWEIILDDDEADSGWVGEVTDRPDTGTPQIGLIKIPIHELYAQPRATQKMIDDTGFDITSWLQNKVAKKFGRDENTAFVTGDGASKPKGFLDYPPWAAAGTYQRTAVEQRTTAAAGVIDGDDIISMQGDLIEDYQIGASWAMTRRTFTDSIVTLKDTSGAYLINPKVIKEGAEKILLGKPVNFFADMPAVAANALSVAYADWEEFYTIVDRFGIRVLRDPYTAKPYIKFYTTKRVGGAVTNYEAGKLLKIKS